MILSSPAYLLVIHGSRDPRTQAAAFQLRQLIIKIFRSKHILTQQNYIGTNLNFSEYTKVTTLDFPQIPLVEIVALELASLTLKESLVEFAQKAYFQGFKRVKILPLFLAPGVHVREDIPSEITLAREQINHQVTIELSPYLGKYSGMVQLLCRKFSELSAQTRILIVHGSRLSGVMSYYENLANQLDAEIIYWLVDPSLSLIKTQIAAGKKRIALLPYFLFPGKTTQAIAQTVATLQAEYPEVELILDQPLGASQALAELIAQEM